MTLQWLLGFQILEKWQIKFLTSKNIHGFKIRTFCCCLVAICCFETALKNWESDVKEGEGPPFCTFLQIFYENFRILVLSYNLPHFFTYIQEDWRKTCPDIRSLLFLCNKDLHTRLTPILIVCQRWRHSEKTKILIETLFCLAVFLKFIF